MYNKIKKGIGSLTLLYISLFPKINTLMCLMFSSQTFCNKMHCIYKLVCTYISTLMRNLTPQAEDVRSRLHPFVINSALFPFTVRIFQTRINTTNKNRTSFSLKFLIFMYSEFKYPFFILSLKYYHHPFFLFRSFWLFIKIYTCFGINTKKCEYLLKWLCLKKKLRIKKWQRSLHLK